MPLSQETVDSIDWAVVGLSGFMFFVGLLGAAATAFYSGSPNRPVAKEFNQLWRARFFCQVGQCLQQEIGEWQQSRGMF